jgi:hypothetical protein
VLGEIRWLSVHTDWLRARVAALDPEAVVWGVEREVTKRTGKRAGVERIDVERFASAKVNTWVRLYLETQDQLLRACAIAHRMGIEERQVELAERLGSAVSDAFDAVLRDLDLTAEQWTTATTAVPARLRALAAQIGAGHAN